MPGVGMTDNLNQFRAFHRLATSVGGEYVHTDLVTNFSPGASFDFVGVNGTWERNVTDEPFASMPKYRLNWGGQLHFSATIEEMQDWLRQNVERLQTSGPGIIELRLGKTGRPLLTRVHAELRESVPDVDLLSRYDAARGEDPARERYPEQGLRMLFHIRQGDTSVIRTPWNSFIPVWDLETGYLEDVKNRKAFQRSYVNPRQFLRFGRQLLGQMEPDSFKNLVFSDGYARAFQRIFSEFHATKEKPLESRRLKITHDQFQQLRESRENYQREIFSPFRKLPSTQCLIGEQTPKFCALIDAALQAHVIVIGPQVRMLPKLLSVYHDKSRPKLFISLQGENKEGKNFEELDMLDDSLQAIYTPAKSPDMDYVITAMREFSSRHNLPLVLKA